MQAGTPMVCEAQDSLQPFTLLSTARLSPVHGLPAFSEPWLHSRVPVVSFLQCHRFAFILFTASKLSLSSVPEVLTHHQADKNKQTNKQARKRKRALHSKPPQADNTRLIDEAFGSIPLKTYRTVSSLLTTIFPVLLGWFGIPPPKVGVSILPCPSLLNQDLS